MFFVRLFPEWSSHVQDLFINPHISLCQFEHYFLDNLDGLPRGIFPGLQWVFFFFSLGCGDKSKKTSASHLWVWNPLRSFCRRNFGHMCQNRPPTWCVHLESLRGVFARKGKSARPTLADLLTSALMGTILGLDAVIPSAGVPTNLIALRVDGLFWGPPNWLFSNAPEELVGVLQWFGSGGVHLEGP